MAVIDIQWRSYPINEELKGELTMLTPGGHVSLKPPPPSSVNVTNPAPFPARSILPSIHFLPLTRGRVTGLLVLTDDYVQ